MQLEQVVALAPLGAGTVVVPHIGAVAPIFAELDIVGVPLGAGLEDKDQLMLGAVERSHAGIAFHPDRDVFQLGIDVTTGREQFVSVAPVHTNKVDCPVFAVFCKQCAAARQKASEFFAAELADTLGKLAVADLSYGNVVRRIDEHDMCALSTHQGIKSGLGGGVTTMDTMVAKLPDIAELANRLSGRRIRFIIGIDDQPFIKLLHGQIDLGQAEPRDGKIEIKVEFFQLQKILAEQPLVPVGVLRQPVVRDPKRLQLRRRQMPDLNDGYPRHSELTGCENPAVPDHDLAGVVDHNWHDKSELANAVRDPIDLTLRMLPRVAGIENEISCSSILNLNLDQPGVGRRVASSAWCGFRCSWG